MNMRDYPMLHLDTNKIDGTTLLLFYYIRYTTIHGHGRICTKQDKMHYHKMGVKRSLVYNWKVFITFVNKHYIWASLSF